jgi:prepilin-type N-terminal cleavage/methylation domain-containing protein
MTNDESRLTKCTCYVLFDIRHSVIPSSFVIRQSSFSLSRAFTLIELIVVIAVIIILAGLVLSTVGYVQKKGARSRAETEIAAISAAIENYKADNGVYPRGQSTSVPPSGIPVYTVATTGTDGLDARVNTDSGQKIYQDACRYLYEQLSGDVNLDLAMDTGRKTYFTFKESMLAVIKDPNGNSIGLSHIKDPFGNSYGYSTANQVAPGNGYNPTFDLWSTANSTDPNQWIKNW